MRVRESPLRHREHGGPFDVIGDVHGCRAELEVLLGALGYRIRRDAAGRPAGADHPDGRVAVFVGDLVDRGPDSVGVLRLVMTMIADGDALCVAGNHEAALLEALGGRRIVRAAGLDLTLDQLAALPDGERAAFREQVTTFLQELPPHLVLDGGRLVVAHAGLAEALHGSGSTRARVLALHGPLTAEHDERGLPVRQPWASDYTGRAAVVYGHTPTGRPQWWNNTLCVDTGCVFGGRLTALRYPERIEVSVPAQRQWSLPPRPLDIPPPRGVPVR